MRSHGPWLDTASEAVQLAAVEENGYSIRFIKEPSEPVQLAAVKQGSYSIQHIKEPSLTALLRCFGWHASKDDKLRTYLVEKIRENRCGNIV